MSAVTYQLNLVAKEAHYRRHWLNIALSNC